MPKQKKASYPLKNVPLYMPADFYMIRVPTLPAHTFLSIVEKRADKSYPENIDMNLFDYSEYQALREIISLPLVRHALAVASLAIFEGITRIEQGENSRRVERTFSRLLRYVTRMSTRPTPFGIFAGVAIGQFAESTTLQLAESPILRTRTRPDMDWLLSFVQSVEAMPALVPQLNVTKNQLLYFASGRVILPSADVYGKSDGRSITLRATPVVRYILEEVCYPILYSDLQIKALQAFPSAQKEQVDQLLWQLWEQHILVSDLHPPLTSAQPASYVLEKIRRLQGLEEAASLFQCVLTEAEALDKNVGEADAVERIKKLIQSQRKLVPSSEERVLQVDTALHLEAGYLNKMVGDAAAKAAETFLRMGCFPEGPTYLDEYRTAFIERYGMDMEVPLLELLSPEAGLDAPSTYTHPPRTFPLLPQRMPRDMQPRNLILCELVAQAINDRSMSIELTEEILQRLEQWVPNREAAPTSLELYCQLEARSKATLDRGEWTLIVSPQSGSLSAGRTFGRFFDILTTKEINLLQHLIEYEEKLYPEAIFAELSYLPRMARGANVAIRPCLRPYEVVINATPSVSSDHVIHLHDLVVGVSANRFYLRSLRLGKEVIICQSHMLNATLAPNICRFLLELSLDRRPAFTSFDWGTASGSPFLPRITQGKVVLSPAQWNISANSISPCGLGSEETRWLNGLQKWREQWRVPQHVYLAVTDNRLLLDLEHPLFTTELKTELSKIDPAGKLILQELLPDFRHLWLSDRNDTRYFSELVVPLIRSDAKVSAGANRDFSTRSYPPRVITAAERRILPGKDWMYLKVYAATKGHDELLAGPVRGLVRKLQEQKLMDRWFFIRYNDPEPQLRLRFHISNSQENELMSSTVLGWSHRLEELGKVKRVCVDTYEREIERYGGPEAIDIFEEVFTVNSNIISNVIASLYTGTLSTDILSVAVFSLDQLFLAWGLDFDERLTWIRARTEKYAASQEFGVYRKLLCSLFIPSDEVRDVGVQRQREQLWQLFAPQRSAFLPIIQQMHVLSEQGNLWGDTESILASLAHMNLNRLFGTNQKQERQTYAFWRHTLDSLRVHPKFSTK